MPTFMRRLWAIPIAAFLLMLTAGFAPAMAATPGLDVVSGGMVSAVQTSVATMVAPDTGGVGICGGGGPDVTGGGVYLPINRWGNVSDQHSRLSASWSGDISSKIQRDGTVASLLSVGNTEWQWSTNLVQWASRLCLADSVGIQVDSMVGKLGSALTSSGIVVALFILGVGAVLVRAVTRAGRGTFKGLLRIGVAAGVLFMMVNGAMVTDQTGAYGKGSPGWLASGVQRAVSQLSAAPAEAFANLVPSPAAQTSGSDLDCSYYRKALLNRYQATYGVANGSDATLPKVLNSWWETTGERAYINAQFGSQNPYGARVACRLADVRSGVAVGDYSRNIPVGNGNLTVTVAGQQTLTREGMQLAGASAGIVQGAMPWVMVDSLSEDRAIIAYAACNLSGGTWSVDNGFAQVGGVDAEKNVTPADCAKFWSDPSYDAANSPFNWEDDPAVIQKDAGDVAPAVADFLLTFHGNSNGGAITTALTYVLSSTIVAVVFGLLSMAAIVAKLALLGLTFAVIFVLCSMLIPREGEDHRLLKVGQQFLSMAMFTWGVGLLIAFVAIMTGFLQEAGTAAAGAGTTMGILWTGMAPCAALIVVHFIFTKVLKAPSPFKPTSALAYGAAAAGGGIITAHGLERAFSKRSMMARDMTRQVTRRAAGRLTGSSAMAGGVGGRGRRGSLLPAGLAGAAGGAAVAAAGHHGHGGGAPADGQDPAGGAPADGQAPQAAPEFLSAREAARRQAADARSAASYGKAVRGGMGEQWEAQGGHLDRAQRAQAAVERTRSELTSRVRSAADHLSHNRWRIAGKSAAVVGGTALAATAFALPVLPAVAAVAGVRAMNRGRQKASAARHARRVGADPGSIQKKMDMRDYQAYLRQRQQVPAPAPDVPGVTGPATRPLAEGGDPPAPPVAFDQAGAQVNQEVEAPVAHQAALDEADPNVVVPMPRRELPPDVQARVDWAQQQRQLWEDAEAERRWPSAGVS